MTTQSYLGAILLSLSAVAGACGPASDQSAQTPTQATVLARTLASLNLLNPVIDLDANLKRGERRFVGINGYVCTAPGVEEEDAQLLRHYGMKCLEGTSDMIEGDEHESLIRKAEKYAREYNGELKRRIRSGLVT